MICKCGKEVKPESYWNYRVIEKMGVDGALYYEIHEVFYSKGMINGWTKDSINPFGTSVKELQSTLKQMLKDSKAPVLEFVIDKRGKEKLVEIKDESKKEK